MKDIMCVCVCVCVFVCVYKSIQNDAAFFFPVPLKFYVFITVTYGFINAHLQFHIFVHIFENLFHFYLYLS